MSLKVCFSAVACTFFLHVAVQMILFLLSAILKSLEQSKCQNFICRQHHRLMSSSLEDLQSRSSQKVCGCVFVAVLLLTAIILFS